MACRRKAQSELGGASQQLRQARQQQQDLQDRLSQLNALLDNKVKVETPDDAFRLQTV
jgi:uncharacterized protein (DUF3084 family)